MELSSFSENIVTETFERSGDALVLKINIDAIVPEYYEALDERLRPTRERLNKIAAEHQEMSAEVERLLAESEKNNKKPKKTKPGKAKETDLDALTSRATLLRKEVNELNREIFAEGLTCPVRLPDGSATCLLKGWDMTVNGVLIEASKENLLRLPPMAVKALHDFIFTKVETVKKKEAEADEETLESTPSGSKAPLKLAPTG